MKVFSIKDKETIESHFLNNKELNLYQLGDLDDFFFKHTQWFGISVDSKLKQIVLIYTGTELPVLMALCDRDLDEMKTLLNEIKKTLPVKFYSHLSGELHEALGDIYNFTSHGKYLKMSLDRNSFRADVNLSNIRRLTMYNSEEINEFYKQSYPDNWFDKRMLETEKYFGYFLNDRLTGIAGIHVYSPVYKIAVLGNITTDPVYRGRSICTNVTSALCEDLFKTVDIIGLNVHCENIPAIKSYEKIGFRICNRYEEFMFEKKLIG